jgi:hypothetical protein
VPVVSLEGNTPLLALARAPKPGRQARDGWGYLEELLVELVLAEAPLAVPILVELPLGALLAPLDLAAWSVARWAASHPQLLVALDAAALEASSVEDLSGLRDRLVELGWAAGVLHLTRLGPWAELLAEQVRVAIVHPEACTAGSSSLVALCQHARAASWLLIGSGPKDPADLQVAARLGFVGWVQPPTSPWPPPSTSPHLEGQGVRGVQGHPRAGRC